MRLRSVSIVPPYLLAACLAAVIIQASRAAEAQSVPATTTRPCEGGTGSQAGSGARGASTLDVGALFDRLAESLRMETAP